MTAGGGNMPPAGLHESDAHQNTSKRIRVIVAMNINIDKAYVFTKKSVRIITKQMKYKTRYNMILLTIRRARQVLYYGY
jgi:hypothetical protein